MDVLVERWGGLDSHTTSVVAGLLGSPPHGEPVRAIRTFGTMTEDLLALADWLAGAGCTHVAMESTGVSWKPGAPWALEPAGGRRRPPPGQSPPHQGGDPEGALAARLTSPTPSPCRGPRSRTCCGTGCSRAASSPTGPSGNAGK